MIVTGLSMWLRISNAEQSADYGKGGRLPRLRRVNHSMGQCGKWVMATGVPVGIVGLIIWAFTV